MNNRYIYYMNGYEAWKVVSKGDCEGLDGYMRFFCYYDQTF